MANTTPNRDYLYPEPGDRIENFPAVQKATIEKLDAEVEEALNGDLEVSRIPGLPASKIDSEKFHPDRIPPVTSNMLDPQVWQEISGSIPTVVLDASAGKKLTVAGTVVMYESGLRKIPANFQGDVLIYRSMNSVTVIGRNLRPPATGTNLVLNMPLGFRPAVTGVGQASEASNFRPVFAQSYSPFVLEMRSVAAANSYVDFSVSFPTKDDYPTTLPGTPA